MWHAQVLVPCYTEALEIVTETVWAARMAELPPGCSATVWLLDDGHDAAKQAWVTGMADPCIRYISGRRRGRGEWSLHRMSRLRACVCVRASMHARASGSSHALSLSRSCICVAHPCECLTAFAPAWPMRAKVRHLNLHCCWRPGKLPSSLLLSRAAISGILMHTILTAVTSMHMLLLQTCMQTLSYLHSVMLVWMVLH